MGVIMPAGMIMNLIIRHSFSGTYYYVFSSLKFWHEHKVPITHLHRCHLLDYEHQLPSMILSHCHYSLRVGRGQDVKYDHQALEKHILNRFIHGKPLILIDIPQVVYRKDIYTTGTFADVRNKVDPQASMIIMDEVNRNSSIIVWHYYYYRNNCSQG